MAQRIGSGLNGRNKYGVGPASTRTLDGIVFDSKREMARYAELLLLQRAGEISDLKLQPQFEVFPGYLYRGQQIAPITYVADFKYREKGGTIVVEDVKGFPTPEYLLKRKLFISHIVAGVIQVEFREVR